MRQRGMRRRLRLRPAAELPPPAFGRALAPQAPQAPHGGPVMCLRGVKEKNGIYILAYGIDDLEKHKDLILGRGT